MNEGVNTLGLHCRSAVKQRATHTRVTSDFSREEASKSAPILNRFEDVRMCVGRGEDAGPVVDVEGVGSELEKVGEGGVGRGDEVISST